MKDRIRQIQEAQHMSQQIFADYIGVGAATLSSIYNGRTRPTLNIVENIKRKLPSINLEWLMFGTGRMFTDGAPAASEPRSAATDSPAVSPDLFASADGSDLLLSTDMTETLPTAAQTQAANGRDRRGPETSTQAVQPQKPIVIERPARHVTEIRVYYDDQTWESFTPSKTK